MTRNIFRILSFTLFIIFFYIIVIFDVNDYKSDLEQIISEQSNIDLKIQGDLSLDLGIDTKIQAKQLSFSKNKVSILESEEFNATVSVSQILMGRFEIDSLSLKKSKLYGLNIDETIIKTYNIIAGKSYDIENVTYSSIEHIEAEGYFQDDILQINNIRLTTELIEGEGFGNVNPLNKTINISASTNIRTNEDIKKKYNEYYPRYLVDTQLPILISGDYNNPQIDFKISDTIAKKLKEEIKSKAIESIKDRIKDKIQSEINIKLPF